MTKIFSLQHNYVFPVLESVHLKKGVETPHTELLYARCVIKLAYF